MKKIVSLMATLLAANAFAAVNTAPSAVTTATKKLATSLPAKATVTPTTVAPSAATSISANASAVAPTKKITVSYLAENAVEVTPANKKDYDGFSSQQHVGVAYALSAERKVQVRQYFHYNMTDAAKTDEWGMGDTAFQYTDSSAKLAGAPVLFYARYYLPGTEYARAVGKQELRLFGNITQAVGSSLNISYGLNTRIYGYTKSDDAQRGLRVLPMVTFAYAKEAVFQPYATLFTDNSWRHNGRGVSTAGNYENAGTAFGAANSDTFYTDIGTKINLAENVDLNLYIETGKDLRASGLYQFADPDSSAYNLELSASL